MKAVQHHTVLFSIKTLMWLRWFTIKPVYFSGLLEFM